MKKKRILAIVLIAVLLIGGLGLAQAIPNAQVYQ